MRHLIVVVLVWVSWCPPTRAETIDQAYQRAVSHYYGGRFRQAVRDLERLVALPTHHEELYYNLGCAHFRLGNLGAAIFNFERALAMDGGFEDARYNLEAARRAAARKVKDVLKGATVDPLWMRVVATLSTGSWWGAFLVLWWLTLGVFFSLRFLSHGAARAGVIAANSLSAMLCLLCGLMLCGRIYLDGLVRHGIVLPTSVAVREGPDASARSTFKLHAGLKVRLRGESSGWVRVRVANGLEGWISGSDLGRL